LALSVGNNNTNTTYSGGFTSTGSLNKIGSGTLTLTGPSSYSGGTTVTGGVLLADNATSSVGSGAVSVTSTGVLGGTGVINTSGVTSGKAVDIAGELAPTDAATGYSHLSFTLAGTSTLTLEAGSTFAFNLGADVNSSDEVVITGGKLVLTSLDYSNFTFNAQSNFGGAGTYILFADSVGITGSPNADNSGTLDGGAYNGQIMVSGNNLDLVVTSAPEPGTWVMLVSGLAFLVVRNRRKGRLNEGGRA
jgi:autotransporter-associated beta strand protein